MTEPPPPPPRPSPPDGSGGVVRRGEPRGAAAPDLGVSTSEEHWVVVTDDGPPEGRAPEPLVGRGGPPPTGPPAPPLTGPGPDPEQSPSRSRRRTRLAGAIADALLADPDTWTPVEMLDRASLTFDGPQDWLPGLIEQVLEYHPRPPADRPRELAAVVDILLAEVFDGLWAEARRAAVDDAVDVREDDDDSPGNVDDDRFDESEEDWSDESDDGWTEQDEEFDPTDVEPAISGSPPPVPVPVPVPVAIPRPTRRLVAPTRTVRRPFPTPRIDHAADLADLLEVTVDRLTALADTALRGRRAHSPRIANYRYRWLDRPSGPRLLEAPRSRLLAAQRTVLHSLLDSIPVHPAVHGFVAGRSVVTGARAHVGADTVLTLDLEHFFASVTAGRIWGVLRSAGYPEPVAHLLAGLTTTATPVRVIGDLPSGPDPDRQFRLRRRLATPHLPQGAPTSPALANLVAVGLDRRLAAYAAAAGLAYTRYADDLTFSGTFRHTAHVRSFAATVGRIVAEEGFRVNDAKTRSRGRHERQSVTGVVVNDHPAVARDEIDRLRAILHDCRRSGPQTANRSGRPDFRAHLLGRISWVASVHPGRGARLRAQFEDIDWTGSVDGRRLGE